MTPIKWDTAYRLLTDADRSTVSNVLAQHQFFYHGTPSKNLASIKENGLHPRHESEDSNYVGRNREPSKALRYCIKQHTGMAMSAAGTRAQEWNPRVEFWETPLEAGMLFLRVPASVLLARSFGLDHSFGDVRILVEGVLASKKTVSAEEFIDLIERFGSISCYDIIPPEHLEICLDNPPSADGEFISLGNYP